MRTALILLLLAMTALSGCTDADDEPEDTGSTDAMDSDGDGATDAEEEAAGTDPKDAASVPTKPEPLHFEGSAIGVGTGTGADPVCAVPQVSCRDHEFDVPTGGWLVTITLLDVQGPAGSAQPTDYDLYLFDAAGNPAGEATNPGGEANVVAARLAAGTYTAQISAWNDQGGSYTLDIVFS